MCKTYVSFSKVTVADWVLLALPEVGVMDNEVILPLRYNQQACKTMKKHPDLPEAEKVPHFLLARLRRDIGDVNSVRHLVLGSQGDCRRFGCGSRRYVSRVWRNQMDEENEAGVFVALCHPWPKGAGSHVAEG